MKYLRETIAIAQRIMIELLRRRRSTSYRGFSLLTVASASLKLSLSIRWRLFGIPSFKAHSCWEAQLFSLKRKNTVLQFSAFPGSHSRALRTYLYRVAPGLILLTKRD